MIPAPEPLPWDMICPEVEAAARAMGSPRFINVMDIADHIQNNPGSYPSILGVSEWHPEDPVTPRALIVRINDAISRMEWKPWNYGKAKSSGRIFLPPWVPEDPAVVAARESLGTPLFRFENLLGDLNPGRTEP
jgi:hypothetical protein